MAPRHVPRRVKQISVPLSGEAQAPLRRLELVRDALPRRVRHTVAPLDGVASAGGSMGARERAGAPMAHVSGSDRRGRPTAAAPHHLARLGHGLLLGRGGAGGGARDGDALMGAARHRAGGDRLAPPGGAVSRARSDPFIYSGIVLTCSGITQQRPPPRVGLSHGTEDPAKSPHI